jgi:hypothetical protein
VQLFGAVRSLLDAATSQLNNPDRLSYRQSLDEARAQLEPEVFDRAWQSGQALTLDQAIELALSNM